MRNHFVIHFTVRLLVAGCCLLACLLLKQQNEGKAEKSKRPLNAEKETKEKL